MVRMRGKNGRRQINHIFKKRLGTFCLQEPDFCRKPTRVGLKLLAAALLLFSASCMYLLGKSLTLPLGQIRRKMYRAGLGEETGECSNGEEEGRVFCGDEHHMLEQKIDGND